MAAGYFQNRFDAHASFELFVRRLPHERNYLIAAGLEQALDFLENFSFSRDDIDFLRKHPVFRHVRSETFDHLLDLRFTGDVWAVPEGAAVFADEPLLRITAPIMEAQLVETRVLSSINFQTMVASRAARIVTAAAGRDVVEFGARRAHGAEAGIFAARAAWIAGCAGTSNVIAGKMFGIPTYGTQAHSWIMAFETESHAFARFLDVFPEHATLLLDTYDPRAALRKIISSGRKPYGVRLDSGDLAAESRWVRRELDRAGWSDVQIFASGDLDERKIAALLRKGATIGAFGVGSALVAPTDASNLSTIYKLVEVERAGKTREAAKFSEAKATYPGRKQVFRAADAQGKWKGDLIGLAEENFPGTVPLLVPVMRNGKRISPPESLSAARMRCAESLGRLPARLLSLRPAPPYPVRYSAALQALLQKVRRRVRRQR